MVPDPEYSESLEKNNNESSPEKMAETSSDAVRSRKKKKEPNGEISKKKESFKWNLESHEQFVTAVIELGVNNAVPKKILSVLNVPGLKRKHVASHLKKYRLFLEKVEKEKQAQSLSMSIHHLEMMKLGRT